MTARRKLLFWAGMLAIPLVVLGLAEGVARLWIGASVARDRRVNIVETPVFFEDRELEGRRIRRVIHPEGYRARNIEFDAEKAPGALRVFCLGGSASAGWPHPPSEIYSAYLEAALQNAFSNRAVEVINVSAHAYPAYRVRLIFDQVIDFDPDAIVIYSGNNEFLEERRYLRGWGGFDPLLDLANRLASFRLLRSTYLRYGYPENTLPGTVRERESVGMIAKLERRISELRRDPAQLAKVKEHYAESIAAMVREAARRGVPTVLVTVPVNLRDWLPNASYNSLAGERRDAWQFAYERGRRALLEGDHVDAVRLLQDAIRVAPEHAESHFHLARAFEAQGELDRALASYTRAKDLDHSPFRALSDFNATLRDLSERHPSAHLADAEAAFARAGAPRAPGFDLFLDYVHPTKRGNLVVAETVFDVLTTAPILGGTSAAFRYDPAPFDEALRPYDEDRDENLQSTLFYLFGMMHQYESMVEKARHLDELGRAEAAVPQAVLATFPDYLELERRRLLGRPFPPARERMIRAKVRRYYIDAYGIAP